jgi:hypothetical protein
MQQLCTTLNLKEHNVGRSSLVPIYGPADIEGHKGIDGRYYLLDFARYMPPEPPVKHLRGCILYRLLRPELVKKFGKPLSADSFSKFGLDGFDDHNGKN